MGSQLRVEYLSRSHDVPTPCSGRDRCKGRAFDRLWSGYSDEFKKYFRNLQRSDQTAFIHDAVSMGENGRLNVQTMEKFKMIEAVEKAKAKESLIASESCIQEVAELKCGGVERLKAAIARGAVRVHLQNGVEMFSFPSVGVKMSEVVKRAVTSEADTPITSEMHHEFADLLRQTYNPKKKKEGNLSQQIKKKMHPLRSIHKHQKT